MEPNAAAIKHFGDVTRAFAVLGHNAHVEARIATFGRRGIIERACMTAPRTNLLGWSRTPMIDPMRGLAMHFANWIARA